MKRKRHSGSQRWLAVVAIIAVLGAAGTVGAYLPITPNSGGCWRNNRQSWPNSVPHARILDTHRQRRRTAKLVRSVLSSPTTSLMRLPMRHQCGRVPSATGDLPPVQLITQAQPGVKNAEQRHGVVEGQSCESIQNQSSIERFR